jgi:hypothetical protein
MLMSLNYLNKQCVRQGALTGSSNPHKLPEPNVRNKYDVSVWRLADTTSIAC